MVDENHVLRVESTGQLVDQLILGRAIGVHRVAPVDGHVQSGGTGSGIHSLRQVSFELTRAVEPEDTTLLLMTPPSAVHSR